MAVFVTKPDGRRYGVVAEEQLEAYGWGLDPLAAVGLYRDALGVPSDVDLKVHTDEDSHYPSFIFALTAEIGVRTTRPQKAMREIGQFLIDCANGLNPPKPDHFSGHWELNRLDDTEEPN
jgi:hypothetical protein